MFIVVMMMITAIVIWAFILSVYAHVRVWIFFS